MQPHPVARDRAAGRRVNDATFSIYAGGFATASLTGTRASATVRDRLPVVGLLAIETALLTLGLIARGDGWQLAEIAPLAFVAGVTAAAPATMLIVSAGAVARGSPERVLGAGGRNRPQRRNMSLEGVSTHRG